MSARRSLPDFIIIGVQRGGTTSLFEYLSQHPEVATSTRKEVHYFDVSYAHGIDWYRDTFPLEDERKGKVVGEASPYYIFHPLAAERIKRDLPNVKLIVLLRNPIARAYSNFHFQRGREVETAASTFEEAIALEESRLSGELERMLADESYNSENHRKFSYLSRGFYYQQLSRWLALFPREQFLVLKSEALFTDPVALLKHVWEFLGVADYLPAELKVHNQGNYLPIDASTVNRLQSLYQQDQQRLSQILGPEFCWW
jgi:hypothetical protein